MDIPIIAIGLALTVLIASRVYGVKSTSARVTVRSGEKTWIFPLDGDEKLIVEGPIGETLIAISNGRAAIISSPCIGQTCVAAGEMHKSGQWAACLPNKVFLLIEGVSKDAIDAFSY